MASKNNLCIIIVLPKNKIGAEGEQFVTEGAAFVLPLLPFQCGLVRAGPDVTRTPAGMGANAPRCPAVGSVTVVVIAKERANAGKSAAMVKAVVAKPPAVKIAAGKPSATHMTDAMAAKSATGMATEAATAMATEAATAHAASAGAATAMTAAAAHAAAAKAAATATTASAAPPPPPRASASPAIPALPMAKAAIRITILCKANFFIRSPFRWNECRRPLHVHANAGLHSI